MSDLMQDFVNAVNDTGAQDPVPGAVDLVESAMDPYAGEPTLLDEQPGVSAPAVEPIDLDEDQETEEPDDLIDSLEDAATPDDDEFVPVFQPGGDMLRSTPADSRALRDSLRDLEVAAQPMDINELNDYLSRGGFNSNIDPDASRLRQTIRAMMRRNA